jgi:hypothetical protein
MSRRKGAVEVNAANWLIALGLGLEQLGVMMGLDRVACEVLPNGQVLARDARFGDGYVVQPMGMAELPMVEESGDELMLEAPEDTTESTLAWLRSISNASSPAVAAREALLQVSNLIQSEGGAVLILNPDRSLEFLAATGPSGDSLTGHHLPPGAGFAGFSVEHIASITVQEPYADRRFHREVDAITGTRTHSLMVVPLCAKGRVLGCLEVVNARGHAGFSRSSMADAELIAGALAERLAR